jgi:hypothetical protein
MKRGCVFACRLMKATLRSNSSLKNRLCRVLSQRITAGREAETKHRRENVINNSKDGCDV